MISLGLSVANQKTLMSLLVSHHTIKVKVQILDMNHNYVGDVSNRLVEGQVDIDIDAAITRSLKLVLLDPTHALHLDSNSPDEGALFMDRMIRVIYTVINPTGTFSADIPLFCAPIRKLDRTGVLLNIEAHGKEVLSLPQIWWGKTYKKGTRKTSIVYSLLYDSGERKLSIPARSDTIPYNISIGATNSRWGMAKHVAGSLNQQLSYDGRGYAVLRPWPQLTVFNFTESVIKSDPQVGFDLSDVVNAVQVIGGIPKGSKTRIQYKMVAPIPHPLSPLKLGRAGYGLYLPKVIQDDNILSVVQARAIAWRELQMGLLQSISVAADSLPIPLLEGGDICRLSTPEYSCAFRFTKGSIPLTAKGSMAIGYNKRVTPSVSAIRNRRR